MVQVDPREKFPAFTRVCENVILRCAGSICFYKVSEKADASRTLSMRDEEHSRFEYTTRLLKKASESFDVLRTSGLGSETVEKPFMLSLAKQVPGFSADC